MEEVFDDVDARIVTFPNFHTGGEAANTVYLGSPHHAVGPSGPVPARALPRGFCATRPRCTD